MEVYLLEGYKFEKLTLFSDDDIGAYKDALDFVFQNNDIRNIAISGSYGSGKSSVLASYKKNHSDKNYLHISLAHFESMLNENRNDKDEINKLPLEGKIINQLLHKITPSKIPQVLKIS